MNNVLTGHSASVRVAVSPSQKNSTPAAHPPPQLGISCAAAPAYIAIILRTILAVLTVTYFQPDEYFQALEPAHRLVFGYGHLTWEWRAQPPIRNIFFPMLFAPVYWMLKICRLDGTQLLVWAPKVIQGLIASITDLAVRRLARNVLGEQYVCTTFFLSLTSLFHLQALSRTLSNSAETSLTTLALSLWPFASLDTLPSFIAPLSVAAVACMIRPTNAIIWVFLVAELSWRLRRNPRHLAHLWMQTVLIGLISCTFLLFLDSWYFGSLVFTPLNFLLTNLSPVSSFYGRSPWHYYLTQAFPLLCTLCTPFVLQGIWQSLRTGAPPIRRLNALVIWTSTVYSLAAHKEWRFIHPLLPALHVIASKPLVDSHVKNPRLINIWKRITLVIPFALAPYLLLIQSHAQIAVMDHLRCIPPAEVLSIGFLMPCHSTPWQSHLHMPHLDEKTLWAIGCEPPLENQSLLTYKDQSDIFYASPRKYLRTYFPPIVDPAFPPSVFPADVAGQIRAAGIHNWSHAWPSHIVLFSALLEESVTNTNEGEAGSGERESRGSLKNGEEEQDVKTLLAKKGYVERWRSSRWNGWEEDERRRGGIRVWVWEG